MLLLNLLFFHFIPLVTLFNLIVYFLFSFMLLTVGLHSVYLVTSLFITLPLFITFVFLSHFVLLLLHDNFLPLES